MPTGIQLSSGVVVGQPIPLDAKFGPYNSTTDALNDIGVNLRYRGLTVGVFESNVLKEYWFKDGTGNEHFVAKSTDVTWDSLLNKPSTFPPSSHSHPISEVSGAAYGLVHSAMFLSTDINLGAGRNRVVEITNYSGNRTLDLPMLGSLRGDTITIWVRGPDGVVVRQIDPLNEPMTPLLGEVGPGEWKTFVYGLYVISPRWTLLTQSVETITGLGNLATTNGSSAGLALVTAVTAAAQRTLLNVADGAEVNVNADWNATSGDAQILNKPSTFPPSSHTHPEATQSVAGFLSTSDKTKLDKVSVSGTGVRINVTKGIDITDTGPDSATQGQTFTGGASGLIEAKGSAAVDGAFNNANSGENGKAGGSLLLNAGTSNDLVGGAGGSINLSGGNAGGGDGGQILITGGAGVNIAGQNPAGNGGIINLSGGSTNYTNAGGNGGQILMTGGDGGNDNGGSGGTLNLSGGDGNLRDGGSIDLSDGGGSINLRGTGSIQFGISGTRTTFTGAATEDRAISLPDASGTVALLPNDPNADRLVFWDDSAGKLTYAATTGGTFDGTTLRWPVEFVIACSDETSNLTTGTAKVTFRAPYAFTLTGVRASVNTAPTGSPLVVDINKNGTSILVTKLSIDPTEKTSTTADVPAIIASVSPGSDIADDTEITIDIDQGVAGQMGKGLKVVLIGTRL